MSKNAVSYSSPSITNGASGAPNADDFGTDAGRVIRYEPFGGTLDVWGGAGTTDEWFGYSVALLGDLDGDGTPDFAVGAPQSDGVSPGYARARPTAGSSE